MSAVGMMKCCGWERKNQKSGNLICVAMNDVSDLETD
jgi:hypothetical protein